MSSKKGAANYHFFAPTNVLSPKIHVVTKTILPTLFLFCLLASCRGWLQPNDWQLGEPLFPIVKDGKWGFINRAGVECIKPKFRDVGRFADSLAPARLNGTWGYINPKGEFVIPPKYDYATDFTEGYAGVWMAGKPTFINEKGISPWVLPDSTIDLKAFENGIAHFITLKNGLHQNFLLKPNGQITPDTTPEYSEGLAIITREIPTKEGEYAQSEMAVQDSTGHLIVPFGKYSTIDPFHNGFAIVSMDEADPEENAGIFDYWVGAINRKGTLVFTLPKGHHVFENYFSEGLLAVQTNPTPESNGWSLSEDYITWYDTTGKVVWVKQDDHTASPFKGGRTFSGDIRNYYLMDKNGQQLGAHRFEWVADDDFSDNMAIVAQKQPEHEGIREVDLYGVIDSMGKYTIPPQFNHVHEAGFQQEGLLVAMNEALTLAHGSPTYKPIKQYWGLIDRKGKWVFPAKFTKVSDTGYDHGLLYAEIDSLYGYIDPKGKFVWQAIRKAEPLHPEPLNVDFMLRAYCYAFGSNFTNGQVHSPNLAKPGAQDKGFQHNQLDIQVDTTQTIRFQRQYQGRAVYVYNTSADTLNIDTQDNQLYLTAQALNPKGEWQDIEYSPSSWCGNSYYSVRLNPNEYWQFEMPIYDGDYATTLRLAFSWEKKCSENPKTIYSNTFSGKINPGQFWQKQGYSPSNLMDPYTD